MKNLSDADIENMINSEFAPAPDTAKQVRTELHLSTRIPKNAPNYPNNYAKLDLHQYTEEQAWNAINDLINSGAKSATIITGASGILKIKFQQWARDSIISSHFLSVTPINNGSFAVKFRKNAD